jgi:phosphoribosylformylglycinamidine synthase
VFLAKIRVTLKPTVNDPQGKTIAQALGRLGFGTVESVRAGKYFEVKLNDADHAIAEKRVKEICEKLLANPVIERYEFDLSQVTERAQV